MAEEKNFVELRSEEVQEILGTPPNWLVQYGTVVVLLGFGLLLGVAWFVRYPDVVISEKLSITTADPPVEVVARTDGRLAELLTLDTSSVLEKQPLAVLQNTAYYADVRRLDVMVTEWQKLPIDTIRQLQYPEDLILGELQSDYAMFIRDLEDFKFGRERRSNSVQSSIGSIQNQINQLEQSINFEKNALKRSNEDLKIAYVMYEKQKDLFRQGLIAETKFPLSVSTGGDHLFAQYTKDAVSSIEEYSLDGKKLHTIALPGLGTASGFSNKREEKEVYYSYTSYVYPATIFKYDLVTGN